MVIEPIWNPGEQMSSKGKRPGARFNSQSRLRGAKNVKRIIVLGILSLAVLCVAVAATNRFDSPQQKEKTSVSQKGWLGVAVQDITSEMKKAMDLKSREGALVSEVVKKSPADSAGIKEKDVIVQIGGHDISDSSELQKAVADTKPGNKVSVVVIRKGEKKTIDVVIGKQSSMKRSFTVVAPRGSRSFEVFGTTREIQGMALRQLNDQLAKYFDVPEGSGVLVWEVEKGSPAEKAGINAGDVITVVGKKKIRELRDVSRALGIYDDGEKAEIEVVRKGARKTLTLEVEESRDDQGYRFWYNDEPFRNRKEGLLFDVPDFDIHVPEVEIESIRPDLDNLKIEMDKLKQNLKNQSIELRERIQRDVKPVVRVHIYRSL